MSDVHLKDDDSADGIGMELTLSLPGQWDLPENGKFDVHSAIPMRMLFELVKHIQARGEQSCLYSDRDLSRAAWSLEMAEDLSERQSPSTELCAWLLLGRERLTTPDCRKVDVYEAIPIYEEEAEFLRTQVDYVPLLRRLIELGIPRLFDLNRPNAVTDWPEGCPEPDPDTTDWCGD